MSELDDLDPMEDEEFAEEVLETVNDLTPDADMVRIMYYRTKAGIQYVFWPMVLHRHGQDCNRA